MKKLVITFLIILSFNFSYGQMKSSYVEIPTRIGRSMILFDCYLEIEQYKDKTYKISYRDVEYQSLIVFKSFRIQEHDFADLYNILVDYMNDLPKEQLRLEFENDIIYVENLKTFGMPQIKFYHYSKNSITRGTTAVMNKTQFDKLFGKIPQ